jgi:hypothetical protein
MSEYLESSVIKDCLCSQVVFLVINEIAYLGPNISVQVS